MSQATCPVCGATIAHKTWSDDIGGAPTLVEVHEECGDHYEYSYSYGVGIEQIGGTFFEWDYNETEAQRVEREQRRDIAIAETKGLIK